MTEERPPTLIDLFCYAQGVSNTPPRFFFWSAISLVAACVADRVWIQRFAQAPERRTYPNLYILLVGSSAVGKGTAIGEAALIGEDAIGDRLFFGRVTAQGLRDALVKQPTIWLLQEELAFSVHSDQGAFDFITTLVQLFTGANLPPIRDRTRTGVNIQITKACVNWLAGTTPDWLAKTFDIRGFAGGFSRRLLLVDGDSPDILMPEPIYPPDRETIRTEVTRLCVGLTAVTGPMSVSAEANEIYREWFEGRPMPPHEELKPWWTTEDELVFKLAMVLALSAGEMVISGPHMLKAQQEVDGRMSALDKAIRTTASSTDASDMNLVRQAIQSASIISDRALAQRIGGYGILRNRREEILMTLMDGGEVRRRPLGPRGGIWWEWVGRKRSVPLDVINGGT